MHWKVSLADFSTLSIATSNTNDLSNVNFSLSTLPYAVWSCTDPYPQTVDRDSVKRNRMLDGLSNALEYCRNR